MELMDLTHLTPISADEAAALLFVCGDQYLFRYRARDGAAVYKFVSPAAVRAAFAEETIDTTWLPLNVKRWGIGKQGEWLLVAHPPRRYSLVLNKGAVDDETVVSEVPMPALAFFGYGHQYFLWAFKDAELKGDTALFAAPLPNIDANGGICFGSNAVPKASARTIMEAWRLFLASPFSNHSVNGKSRKHPDDVRKELTELAEKHRRRYPIADLVSCNRTANTAIEWTLNMRGIR
jgi:PRTRC genetic system protein B